MASTPFACAYDASTHTLTLTGDVDEAGALELRRQLTALTHDQATSLVMDLSSVGSLPSSAVGVIAAARAQMRSRFTKLSLVAAQGSPARRVLPRFGMSVGDA
jgi:anti-anti-sigma factor